MFEVKWLIDLFITYYNIIFFIIFIYINNKKENPYNLKTLNKKNEYIILFTTIFFYFLIKPVFFILLLITSIAFITFLFKIFTKKKINFLEYIKIEKIYHIFINIYIYKYNLFFLNVHKMLNYNKKSNIKIKNKLIYLIKALFNILIFYIIGIPFLYIKLIFDLTKIISQNVKKYNFFLKKKKSRVILIYMIYLDILIYLNIKIEKENMINKNNCIYQNFNEKNGFIKDFILLSLKKSIQDPFKLNEFLEIKKHLKTYINTINNNNNLLKNELKIEKNLNLEEKNELKIEKTSIIAGKKNDLKIIHHGLKFIEENNKKSNYSLVEVYSTYNKNREKLNNNTEIIIGNDFNTSANICIINNTLIGKKIDFSKNFKKNNNIETPENEINFLLKRKNSIEKKLLDNNFEVKIIEKEEEYVDLFKNQFIKLNKPVEDIITTSDETIRQIISEVCKDNFIYKKNIKEQKEIINEINFKIKNISKEEFHSLLEDNFKKEEINYLIKNYITINQFETSNELLNNKDIIDNF